MADRKETLEDIVAEMRKQANEPTIESLGEIFPPVGPDDAKDWADRIEAAAKRERDLASIRAIHAVANAVRDASRKTEQGGDDA